MTIKKVIKRDNRVEDFDIGKINKWQRWAIYYDKNEKKPIFINWPEIVMKTINKCPEIISTEELQKRLINTCMSYKKWSYSVIAGRLQAALNRKKLFNNDRVLPSIKELHRKLVNKGLMIDMWYTDSEYEALELIIDHDRDFELSKSQIDYIESKYSLRDNITGEVFETPQFTYMRMAMHLAYGLNDRVYHAGKFYYYLSKNKINAPTPNFVNLGTKHRGYSSCCLYTVDDNAKSLSIGDYIAYTMTYMSAGIGAYIKSRSLGDSVRGGRIEHNGKLPYFRSLMAATNANTQGGRGGAATAYVTCYDPEIISVIMAQNQRTPLAKQIRNIHFAVTFNNFFIEKVIKDEDIFLFNTYTAYDLNEAIFNANDEEFKTLYEKYEKDENFEKKYIKAREVAITLLQQCHEISTIYYMNASEVNRHTPHLDKIYSSNLCLEITQPTKAYNEMINLFSRENNNDIGEISLCSLAGIVDPNIENDEEREEASYYALLMIDRCIDLNDYPWPHLEVCAKSRRNAGVGLIGLSYSLAKRKLKYDEKEGRKYIHEVSEKHAYYLIKASLKLAKEFGVAAWINKTKWPSGWLPIDTYNKNVDTIVDNDLKCDWESLRKEIIEVGGIRNSSLIAHMPSESSSKASGVPNSIYPIRDLHMYKTDLKTEISFSAIDNDNENVVYQSAWEIDPVELIKTYSIIQKFTDQSISLDLYYNRVKNKSLTYTDLLKELIACYKYGIKTKYYTNSLTIESTGLNKIELVQTDNMSGCSSGACTL